jgi:hypothetical protein
LSYFEVTGNVGADGSGLTDSAVLTMSKGGHTFKGFVKRIYNAGDPSVNHLIIVADNGSVNHQTSTDTNNDFHRLTGIAGVTRLYYLLYARSSGGYIDNTATSAIMSAFLDAVGEQGWADFSEASGTVLPGATQTLYATAYGEGLSVGNHPRSLVVTSNDPASPQVIVPVTLQVMGTVDSDGDGLPDYWETRHGWSAGDGNPGHGGAGDLDRDGLSNWKEFVFDLDPLVSDAQSLPAFSTQLNPSDGQRYLTYSYRRLLGVTGLTYSVQLSTDMQSWTSNTADYVELSATPNLGGASETVLVRVLPSLATPDIRKFVRVFVSTP